MANPGLLAYFENYAQQFLAARQPAAPITAEVTRIILAHLDNDGLTIGKVARELSMSVRTLQNRLDDEGVVFSDLLKDIRERLAKQYLREDYTVEQITYLLGFSEPAAFRKAFKKWAGLTPREYRDQFSVLPGAD
jgi:AraC-like DNA-binding protein